MDHRGEAEFRPEELRLDSLTTRAHRWLVAEGVGLVAGLLTGLIATLGVLCIDGSVGNFSTSQLFGALGLGLFASFVTVGVTGAAQTKVVDEVQWSWLGALVGFSFMLIYGLISGLAIWAIFGGNAPAFGVGVIAMAGALLGGFKVSGGGQPVLPDEGVRTSLRNAKVVWLPTWLLGGLIGSVLMPLQVEGGMSERLWLGLAVLLITWLIGGLIAATQTGVVLAFKSDTKRQRPTVQDGWSCAATGKAVWVTWVVGGVAGWLVHQGIGLLIRVSDTHWYGELGITFAVVLALRHLALLCQKRRAQFAGSLFGALLIVLSSVTFVMLIPWVLRINSIPLAVVALIIVFGCCLSIAAGGRAWMSQIFLRALLAREGNLPADLLAFLDEADSHGLLRRVGGGYTFFHDLLLKYFAEGRAFDQRATRPVSLLNR